VLDTEKLESNAYANITDDVRQPLVNSLQLLSASAKAAFPARRAQTCSICAISASTAPWSCSTASAS
jgi:hypothetical protein